MSISNFEFSKNWTDSDDFPTKETSESQVREDLQLLHDEMKNFINSEVIPLVNANESNIAAMGGGGSINGDQIDDHSITGDKLDDKCITEDKLDDESVSGSALQESIVDTNHIVDGAVTADKLDSTTVNQFVSDIVSDSIENDPIVATTIKPLVRDMTLAEWGIS